MEVAGRKALLQAAAHPYTQGLLASIPRMDTDGSRLTPIPGHPPSLIAPPSGCPFHPRCVLADARCRTQAPALLAVAGTSSHLSACWLTGREDVS
jgi:oligopeptide/dipeptide ABC transporter ATP-binding protein